MEVVVEEQVVVVVAMVDMVLHALDSIFLCADPTSSMRSELGEYPSGKRFLVERSWGLGFVGWLRC